MFRKLVLLTIFAAAACGGEGRNIVAGDSSLPPVPQDVMELPPEADSASPEEVRVEEASPELVDTGPDLAEVELVLEVVEVEDLGPETEDLSIDVEPPECLEDSDCDDGIPCTTDSCKVEVCFNIKDSNECCVTDADCENGDACSVGLCDVGVCEQVEVDSCCHFDPDCKDELESTFDYCKNGTCIHSLTPEPTACAALGYCEETNDCAQLECVAGFCSASLVDSPLCCDTASDCNDGLPCTEDECVELHCLNPEATGLVPHIAFTFDDAALPGFVVEDDGSPVKWQVSSKSFISPPSALYFGDPATESYSNGQKAWGTIATPPITMGAEGPFLLRAWTYVNTEPYLSVDQVFIIVDDGSSQTEVWSKANIGGTTAWQFVQTEVDLADFGDFAEKEIKLTFLFDSHDALDNDYEGVYFDDVELLWPCP